MYSRSKPCSRPMVLGLVCLCGADPITKRLKKSNARKLSSVTSSDLSLNQSPRSHLSFMAPQDCMHAC